MFGEFVEADVTAGTAMPGDWRRSDDAEPLSNLMTAGLMYRSGIGRCC